MKSARTGCRGFLLIELLAVVATNAVLIGLLLPATPGVREAAAAQAAVALRDAPYSQARLCTAPVCNALDGNQRAVDLPYPEIGAAIELAAVQARGLRVRYDQTLLETQPFVLAPWTDNNVNDPGIVTMDLTVYTLLDEPYAIRAVDWLADELVFKAFRNDGGPDWTLRALIAPDAKSVRVVVAPVPEPSGLRLAIAALAAMALMTMTAARRRTGRR